ncbi:3-oxoacyl-ACP reductase [Corynebacterium lizhenjunii]|uniref:3-oxoacyl-ACP reductase n=1 Tax=Corynebacterium lizhenjunii TaxID=2709394 RepID=A0A7T0KFT0_9CORY|nr:3-oxoacyl-ACP reductase [Corynebacterium lizhenjunii]QPK78888.1 3-oxoacyl-ACP reductase [Corynebacterium lizhenjunii]
MPRSTSKPASPKSASAKPTSPKPTVLDKLINSPLAAKAGVPQGYPLRRYSPGQPPLEHPVVLGGHGRLVADLTQLLESDYQLMNASADTPRGAIVFDATALETPQDLRELYDFFHPQLKKLAPCARLLVIGPRPTTAAQPLAHITARALEGFTRSLAKEMRKGATVNLIHVDPQTTATHLESTLRFFLSGRSAFVDGQVVHVGSTDLADAPSPAQPADSADAAPPAPLTGRLAVVTGAARGIGATIAEVLARDGAQVICIDVPGAGEHLAATANRVKGTALPLDVTAPDAAATIASHAQDRYGRAVDVLVHNAGITRDKLLVNMDATQWDQVLAVNLFAPVRITQQLLEADGLAPGAAVVGVSSMAGISGNRGQTNYATTKAGIIGLVDALYEPLAAHNSTINAVAPGFIETAMTAAMPTGPREVGRRINSLQQAGQPVDVAETVAYFAAAASRAVSGNTVRVCGQNMMGA